MAMGRLIRGKSSSMGRSKQPVLFAGQHHKSIAALYSSACAKRDGPDVIFEACSGELCRLMRMAGELPSDPVRTLRLRRDKTVINNKTFYELTADLSDNTTTNKLSLKKACRAAFKP